MRNPVLRKEMHATVRSRKLMIGLLFYNVLLALWAISCFRINFYDADGLVENAYRNITTVYSSGIYRASGYGWSNFGRKGKTDPGDLVDNTSWNQKADYGKIVIIHWNGIVVYCFQHADFIHCIFSGWNQFV